MDVNRLRLSRMLEIRGWLKAMKVCAFCALRKALVQVEREMGQKDYIPDSYVCRRVDAHGRTCQQNIDACWGELGEATLWARTAELIAKGLSGDANSSPKASRPGSSSASYTSSQSAKRSSVVRGSG